MKSGALESSSPLLIARAKDGAEDLTRILSAEGIAFDDVPIYEKTPCPEQVREKLKTAGDADFAAFTSSSAVSSFAQAAKGLNLGGIKAVCIGETTAATALSYGMEVYVSPKATIESMVEKIEELSEWTLEPVD